MRQWRGEKTRTSRATSRKALPYADIEGESKMEKKMDFVILAAGRGERLWPITNHIPKTMVRILKKPLLEWTMEGIYDYANKIIIVVGFQKEKVIEHFSKTRFADKIVFVTQDHQSGTGHALLQAESHLGEEFVVVNGDNFFDPKAFEKIIGKTKERKWFLCGKKVENKSSYGEIIKKNGFLEKIIEKPEAEEPGLINTNLAFLPNRFFS